MDADIDAANAITDQQVFTLPAGRYTIRARIGLEESLVNTALSVALKKVQSGADLVIDENVVGRSLGTGVGGSAEASAIDLKVDGTEQFYVAVNQDNNDDLRGNLHIERTG